MELLSAVIRLAMGIALEVLGYPKPGNVHRLRDFSDTILEDFVVTSLIGVAYLYRAARRGAKIARGEKPRVLLGDAIFGMVSESREVSGGGNTCLGTSLLLAPLAAALGYLYTRKENVEAERLATEGTRLLREFSTVSDAVEYYKAIRAASPSYLKPEDRTEPLPNVWDPQFAQKIIAKGYRLWDILSYSSKRDVVAQEVVSGYRVSLGASRYLRERLETHGYWNRAVVETYLWVLSQIQDSVIVLKHGKELAEDVQKRARDLLGIVEESWESSLPLLKEFDSYLGNRGVNPGSSADIVATAIALYAVEKRCKVLRPGPCQL